MGPRSLWDLRSEGLAVNSPVREGGDASFSYLSAEGASAFVTALRASGSSREWDSPP